MESSRAVTVQVDELMRTSKNGKQWSHKRPKMVDEHLRAVRENVAKVADGTIETLIVVGNGKMRHLVHDLCPSSLVHTSANDGPFRHLFIFCRRRPLLLFLMNVRRVSYELYTVLSKALGENHKNMVVWPRTLQPPRRTTPAPKTDFRFLCDECNEDAEVVNWRNTYLCQACYENLDDEKAGWKWESLDFLH